ncbi:N-acetylmuramoyl-L-alanine amidase [Bhargavaea beijingensis]|uniref:N-acetylmuramoyl-L-alanine amidase n=1 Tax=Bhargavaea beijingensis TaxID=426756 RepID=UPI00115FAD3A
MCGASATVQRRPDSAYRSDGSNRCEPCSAGANVFASLHHNAFTGEWHSGEGTEVHVSTGSSAKSVSLTNATAPKIAQAMGLNNRGVKRAYFLCHPICQHACNPRGGRLYGQHGGGGHQGLAE